MTYQESTFKRFTVSLEPGSHIQGQKVVALAESILDLELTDSGKVSGPTIKDNKRRIAEGTETRTKHPRYVERPSKAHENEDTTPRSEIGTRTLKLTFVPSREQTSIAGLARTMNFPKRRTICNRWVA